ncbi:DUF4258 domain-containing protein [Candidatus Parcubacteria bacterium]|nr:DUF4258 domain-containing protein [Candidatus Parcubacteria bacterium]
MIIFTQHALLKLEQRNIPKLLVVKTLEFPDYEFDSYGERGIVYKKFSKLYLKVIYMKEGGNIIVITQYWEEKPRLIK